MSDPNTGAARRSLSRTILSGAWFSQYSRSLTGRHGGLQALVLAAVVNLILFALFLTCATPAYETNDDLMMQLIASGFYTGHPDAHLVFTNILIGWVLQFLYQTWAGCNWYLIYILVVHFAALTAIAFLVMARRFGWLSGLLYVGFFLVAETHILLHLQFTTTAFLAGTAGLLLLVDGLPPGSPAHWPRVLAGVALVGLTGLVREPVALLLAVVAAPFLLERFGLAAWRRLLGAVLACGGILVLLHGINHWAYQRDPAWAEYAEYNHMRGEIHDTPLENFIPQAAPAVGWSQNDGWMFSRQYFSDPDVHAGVPKLRLFLARLKALARDQPASVWGFPASLLFLPRMFGHDAGILMKLAILNAIGCLFVAGAFRHRCLVTLLVYYGLFLVIGVYLFKTARLPERVSYNLPLFVNAICLYWAGSFQKRPVAANQPARPEVSLGPLWRAKMVRGSALALVTVWGALYLFNLSQLAQNLWVANAYNQNLKRVSRQILGPLRTLSPAQEKPVLIAMPNDSVLEQCIFFYPATERVPFYLVPYGWITGSPIYNQILERCHLHPYSLSLVDRPDIFFLVKMRWKWLEPLKIFYREHYGLDVRFDPALDTDEMPQFEDCQLYLYQAHVVGGPARQLQSHKSAGGTTGK
jgi:hypothetical protein